MFKIVTIFIYWVAALVAYLGFCRFLQIFFRPNTSLLLVFIILTIVIIFLIYYFYKKKDF